MMMEPLDDTRAAEPGSAAPSISVGRVGLLVGAGTAGVLIGFGLRHGTALQPFAAASRTLLGSFAVRLPEAMLAFIGAAIHFTVSVAVAWATVSLARAAPRRALVIAAIAAMAAASVWAASTWVFPATMRAFTADLSWSQQLFYFVVLGVTLWCGIRFAPLMDQAGFVED